MKNFDKFEDFKENASISKENSLLRAKYRCLSIYELRILNLLISKIDQNSENCLFTFKIAEIAEFCGFDKDEAYSKIKNTCMKLRSRSVYIPLEKGYLITGWISSAKCQSGIVQFELDHKLLPYLKAARNFTVMNLNDVNKFSNIYAQRIYEWLIEVQYKARERKLSIEEIKTKMEISKLYPDYDNFRRRVIAPAISDINQYTNMRVEVLPIRTGRQITDLIFKFSFVDNNIKNQLEKCPKCGGQGYFIVDDNTVQKCYCKVRR